MTAVFHPHAFPTQAARALSDERLRAAVESAQDQLQRVRTAATTRVPDFDALRDRGRDVRDASLRRMDTLLESFESNLTRRGGRVHWARDAAEACRIVTAICHTAQARTVVKSKSMVTEEIELASVLERDGFEVVETDLGEYIIQLRGDRPSHLVLPALHVDRTDVASRFRSAHDRLPADRPLHTGQDLVKEARMVLRSAFMRADVGITGANFLIADSGAMILATNEGNADLTAALPRVHIVVTGIEKVIASFEEAAVLLRLLARSATGQTLTAYTSIFTGPRQPGESSGPEALEVVLVDNGRSDILGSEFEEMLRCIRCGACLNHCPVYRAIGGHAYGSVYPGPMGAVLTPGLAGIESAAHLPNASTFCGRCEEVCPVRIPLPKLMRHWREREFERHLTARTARWGLGLWSRLASRPAAYRIALNVASAMLRLRCRTGGNWLCSLPSVAGAWTRHRDLRAPLQRTFQAQWMRSDARRGE